MEWQENDQNMSMKVDAKGGFITDDLLRFTYNSKGPIKNFGSVILELSPNNERMEGLIIGFGSEQKALISGRVSLRKN